MNALKRYSRTLFCSVGFLVTALVAGCGGGGDQGRDPILGLPAATLVSLAVTPATASVAIGATQQFSATASYSDGSSRDVTTTGAAWTSATTAAATVAPATGLATGVTAGSSVITAAFGGKSASATLTVLPATLRSIAISPVNPAINIGVAQQFSVTGTFSDNTVRDVTAASTFASATSGVATVNAATGRALGVAAGTSVITATSGAQTASTTLTVNPVTLVSIAIAPQAPALLISGTRQLAVTATYSNGTTTDVTSGSTYVSATPANVTVAGTGMLTGVAAGSSVITATFGAKTATTTATVGAATLSSIAVTPATASVAIAGQQQFVATGTYSDNSTAVITSSVAWTSANSAIATVLNTGVATGVTAGSTTITATLGAKSGSAALTVNPITLVSIAVAPQAPSLLIAGTRQLAVTATYSNGSTADVTAGSAFVSATPASVTVNNSGLLNGVAAGSSVVTATFGGRTATTTATVAAATLSSIAVTPATATVAIAGQQQFVATGTYSDNSSAIITSSVVWSSANTATAIVVNTGLATGVSAGTTTITATLGAKSGNASLTVNPAFVPPPLNPVNLGTAANFGVLAGTSITNNSGGLTLVKGDVGSPSQTTAPVVAPGFTNYTSGAILDKAFLDLDVAITDANSRACTNSFPGGDDLGGKILSPGVYCYGGAISITGTLILNGPGVYIFRTPLTLNTTANSIVSLLGNATADNVTWVPVGATTLGANSAFQGTVLGRAAAITAGDNASLLNGRVLSTAAVTLSNNKITK